MLMMNNLGAAIFDEPQKYDKSRINSGFKCIHGEEPEPISGVGDLSNDVHWITNIPYEPFIKNQLAGTSRLLGTNFLRHNVDGICSDLGISNLDSRQKSIIISQILHSTFNLAVKEFSLSGMPALGLSAGIASTNLTPIPAVSSEMRTPSGEAFQNYTRCEYTYRSTNEQFSVWLPRLAHGEAVLQEGFPLGSFKLLGRHLLPASNQERLQFLDRIPFPFMAHVTIDSISDEVSHLLNWSNGAPQKLSSNARFKQNNSRSWVCGNEFNYIRQYADIKINDVALSDAPLECSLRLPYRRDLVKNGNELRDICSVSYSYGLLAENYWASLTRNAEGKIEISPLSSWIHASDRIRTIHFASNLSKAGFDVKGFGFGRIDLSVRKEQIPDLTIACISNGLLFPIHRNDDIYSRLKKSADGAPTMSALYQIYTGDGLSLLLDFEKHFLGMGG